MRHVYEFRLAFGICLILQYKVLFNYILEHKIIDEIHYSFDEEKIQLYRGNYPAYYKDGMKKIAEFLFNDSRIIQKENQDFQFCCRYKLQYEFKIPNNLVLDYKSLITEEPLIKEEYITINTKVVDINLDILSKIMPQLLDILKHSKYTIIIIGEKNMTECHEYTIHKDYYCCIYNNLIGANLKCIDMTYTETYDGYSVEALKKSMNLSKYAKYNIILNSGGGLALGLGFENVIGLCGTISSEYNMFDYSLSQIFHPPSQINNFLIAIAQNISSLKVDLLNPEVC